MDTVWVAFPLHPEIPEEGLTLEELFRGRNSDMDEMMARLKRVAREEGLPLGDRRRTYNSRLAQELGKWAEEKGRGEDFHAAVFRAYFADGKNIGKQQVLADSPHPWVFPLMRRKRSWKPERSDRRSIVTGSAAE